MSQENLALPRKSFFKLHGRFGIGSVTYSNPSGLLSTAGRDGKIQTFEIDEKSFDTCVDVDSKSVRQGGTTRLKFAWLEKIVDFDGKTFILGFHSDQFVVYNLTNQVKQQFDTYITLLFILPLKPLYMISLGLTKIDFISRMITIKSYFT